MQPFIIIRLKENAEERHVCDQEDGQNSAIPSHRTKKVTQVGAIREVKSVGYEHFEYELVCRV